MKTREYGSSGPTVVLVHGGPGAPGSLAPLARELADSFRVLEPLQRGSGREPLTVGRHVADLHGVLEERCPGHRPSVVGHSWGAMLALAHAAAHPETVGSLVLIGCGTFSRMARERMRQTLESRTDARRRRRLERLAVEVPDPDARLRAMAELLLPLYSWDLLSTDLELEECDARAHRESWEDMVRLQDEGVYPAAFVAIESPVLMLHGAADPHPGRMIRDSLEAHLPRLEYREWKRCGHYPWLEREARDELFSTLRDWLTLHASPQM